MRIKKALAIIICLCMCFSLFPTGGMAEEWPEGENEIVLEEQAPPEEEIAGELVVEEEIAGDLAAEEEIVEEETADPVNSAPSVAGRRDYDNTVITGFAGLPIREMEKEHKPALVALQQELPEELAVSLGGTVLYAEDAEGRPVPQGVEAAEEAVIHVTWACVQDYDEGLDAFDFVAVTDGYALAEGLTPPRIRVRVGDLVSGPLGGGMPGTMEEAPVYTGDLVYASPQSSYNAYELGLLPPVRNQNPFNTCWDFASLGAVEADLIRDGRAGRNLDLSELYQAYYATHPYTGIRNRSQDTVSCSTEDYLMNSGSAFMTLRMMACMAGPVAEADAPYPDYWDTYQGSVPGGRQAYQLTGMYHLNPDDRDGIKNVIQKHGAAITAIYYDEYYYSPKYNSYYNPSTMSNHVVMIVGWDDAFPRSQFKGATPPGDGAWLVRNSWGVDGYDVGGYFWLSYYDGCVYSYNLIAVDAENVKYDHCYSYDNCPFPEIWITDLYAGDSVSQSFTMADTEQIRAVSFEVWGSDLTATVTVSCGSEKTTTRVSTTYPGFYLAALDKPLTAAKGSRVTVSLSFDADTAFLLEDYSSPYCMDYTTYTSRFDGSGYTILTTNGETYGPFEYDARIKMFTNAVSVDPSPSVCLQSANVDFDGLIHLMFRYDISGVKQALRSNTFVVFRTGNSELGRVPLDKGDPSGTPDTFYYQCPVPIINYTDTIRVTVESASGTEIATTTGSGKSVKGGYPYSLQTYAEKKAKSGSEKMKALALALQDYGIAARLFFGRPVSGLTLSSAVRDLKVSDMSVNETVTTPMSDRPAGVSASQNVAFDSDNAMIVTFTVKQGGRYAFKVNGLPEKAVPDANGRVVLRLDNIAPDRLDTVLRFSCTDLDSGKSFDVTTGVLGYAKRKAGNSSDPNMPALAKALYLYAQAAEAYLSQ